MAEVVIDVRAEDNFSGVLGNFGSIITGIESALNLVGNAFAAVIEPVINFGQESILAAARVSELEVVNRILGENAGIPYLAIEKEVEAVKKMGIEAAVANTVIADFIDANLDIALAADIARIAQDAAVISGENSTETTRRIIDGIVTLNPLILRNAGIIVDLQLAYKEWADENDRTVESLTTAEKQQIALNEVMEAGVGIAGAYAAAMEEPGKVLRSFPRYFDDIMIAVGEPFQAAFGTVIFALADFAKWIGVAVSEGGELRPILDDIAGGAEVVADIFVKILEAIQNGNLDEVVAGLFQNMADAVDTWSSGTGPQELTDKIVGWIENIGTDSEFQSKALTAMGNLLAAFVTAAAQIEWIEIGTAIDNKLAEVIRNIAWEESGRAFGDALSNVFGGIDFKFDFEQGLKNISPAFMLLGTESGQAFVEGFLLFLGGLGDSISESIAGELQSIRTEATGWGSSIGKGLIEGFLSIDLKMYEWVQDHIVNPVKDFLGISSPSSVFADIGRDIILGLIAGVGSLWSTFANYITGLLENLLNTLSLGNIFDALLGDGTLGTSDTVSSDSGLGGLGGTTTTTGSGTVVNQYFAGATINVGSWDQIAYECIYPNPFLAETSGQLGTTGGRSVPR